MSRLHLFHRWSPWRYKKVVGRRCPGFVYFKEHRAERTCRRCGLVDWMALQ